MPKSDKQTSPCCDWEKKARQAGRQAKIAAQEIKAGYDRQTPETKKMIRTSLKAGAVIGGLLVLKKLFGKKR